MIPSAAPEVPPLRAFVDGWPQETHKVKTAIGGEPVEDGVQATDHAVFSGEEVSLTGWVSGWTGGRNPADAWGEVRRLARDLEPVRLVTEWGIYPEMLIAEAEAPKTVRGMRFTVKFRWINRVGITENELPEDQVTGPAEGRSGEVSRGRVAIGDPE